MWCNNMWHKNYSVLRKVAHQPRHTNVQVLLTGKYPRQVFGLATSETLKKGRPGLWVSSMKLTKPHMVQVGGERLAKKLRMLRMFETWKLQVFHHLPTKTYSTHHMCSIVGRDQTRVCVCIRLCNLYIHIFIYIYMASNLYPDWRDGISFQKCRASTASWSSARRTGFWRT